MRSARALSIWLAAIISVLSAACVFAAEEPTNRLSPVKSMMSFDTGYATDGQAGQGIVGCFKSMTFFGRSDFYWGFTSIFGSFTSTGQTLTETGLLFGCSGPIAATDIGFDLSLNVIPFGGRVDTRTTTWQSDAPAIQPSVGFSVPYSSDFGVQVGFAPVVRPYNLQTGRWDFSRSYFIFSLAVELRSFARVMQGHWAERDQ